MSGMSSGKLGFLPWLIFWLIVGVAVLAMGNCTALFVGMGVDSYKNGGDGNGRPRP